MPRTDLWTEAQDATVRRHYGRLHPDHVLRLVNQRGPRRNLPALRLRAQRLNAGGIPPGYGVIHDIFASTNGAAFQRAVDQAKADGVHKQLLHARGRPHIAPHAWIDEYQAEILRQYEHPTNLEANGWVTTADLATELDVPSVWITSYALKVRGRLGKAFGACRRYRAVSRVGRPLLWHPDDAEQLMRLHGTYVKQRYATLRRTHSSRTQTVQAPRTTHKATRAARTPVRTTQNTPVPSSRV